MGIPVVSVHRGVAILLPALRSLPHGRRINRIIQLKKSPVCLQTRPRALGAPAPAPANAGPGKKMTQEQRSRQPAQPAAGDGCILHSLGRAAYYGVVKSHEGSVLYTNVSGLKTALCWEHFRRRGMDMSSKQSKTFAPDPR